MGIVQWEDDLELRIPDLDRQHQILIELTNAFYHAYQEHRENEELRRRFLQLQEALVFHMDAEEALMQTSGFVGLAAHRREHIMLKIQLEKLYDKLSGRDHSAAADLLQILQDWLTRHIREMDRKYVVYMMGKNLAVHLPQMVQVDESSP
ncbi:bacteriohemerythrin [bacterium]|nr:bacteriohemerythrin [bacterium]